jgi:hypothetical protein
MVVMVSTMIAAMVAMIRMTFAASTSTSVTSRENQAPCGGEQGDDGY